MAGYHNYSMSNNAVAAYYNGEKPFSKWTKLEIIDTIKSAIKTKEINIGYDLGLLQKIRKEELKNLFLHKTSWHHTSNHYNRTDFYSVDLETVENITTEKILEIINSKDKNKKSDESEGEKWKCAFLEWSGTRKHPKATEYIEEGVIRGKWFFRKDGTKKSTSANGFRFIERLV